MKVSVILPIYNAEQYLAECLDSLLAQTMRDFEILAVNDGSTDKSGEILSAYVEKDARIKARHFNKNYGEPRAVQHAWREAQGEYLARMDNDDICLPERFAAQVNYLEVNPRVTVLGSNMQAFGAVQLNTDVPLSDADIKGNLVVARANIMNPTAMWRRQWFAEKNLFYGDLKNVSDYGLWVDCMLAGGVFANLKPVLLKYRVHAGQATKDTQATDEGVQMILGKLMGRLFPQLDAAQALALTAICHMAGERKGLQYQTIEQAFAAHAVIQNDTRARFGENRSNVLAHIAQMVHKWQSAVKQAEQSKAARKPASAG